MDEKLENFVGLLSQHRQPRPVSDEFGHLPDWARRALKELPDANTRQVAPPAARAAQRETPFATRPTETLEIETRRTEALKTEALKTEARRIETPPAAIETAPIAIAEIIAPKIVPDDVLKRSGDTFRQIAPPADLMPDAEPASDITTIDDFAAVLAAADASLDLQRVAARIESIGPTASGPARPAADSRKTRRGLRLVHALVPMLAVAVIVVGGGMWYTRAGAGVLALVTAHRAAGETPAATPAPRLADSSGAKSAMAHHGGAAIRTFGPPPVSSTKPDGAVAPPKAMATEQSKVAATARVATAVAKPVAAKPAPAVVAVRPPPKFSTDTQLAMLVPPGVEPPNSSPAEAPPQPAPLQSRQGQGANESGANQSGGNEASEANEPAWLRYAVPSSPVAGEPRIAIVIDDLGIDQRRTARAIALKGPVSLSFLAYASDLPQQTAAAREAGHELIVHVPMEPIVRPKYLGANAGASGLAREEVLRRLKWDLSRFAGYVGVNNHMGSEISSDPETARTVMQVLKQRGLLFLDSRGGDSGATFEVAQRLGVPTATRDIFLDDDVSAPAINARLAVVEKLARDRGTAIAIGHPHDRTLDALAVWLATLPSKGLQLVPVTAIVKERERHPVGVN
jgi:hypothetical protein